MTTLILTALAALLVGYWAGARDERKRWRRPR